MTKRIYYKFSKKELDNGIKLCKQRAKQLALDAQLLAQNNSLPNALGLYTIALEEFGKGQLLKENYKRHGEKYLVPTWVFGKFNKERINSHSEKIKKSVDSIPFDCRMITLWGIKITKPYPKDTRVRIEGSDEPILIAKGLTGEFSLAIDPDLEARLRILYVDWNNKKRRWFQQYKPEKGLLLHVISTFLEFLNNPRKYTISRDEKGISRQKINY